MSAFTPATQPESNQVPLRLQGVKRGVQDGLHSHSAQSQSAAKGRCLRGRGWVGAACDGGMRWAMLVAVTSLGRCCPACGLGAGLLHRCSCSRALGAERGSPSRAPPPLPELCRPGHGPCSCLAGWLQGQERSPELPRRKKGLEIKVWKIRGKKQDRGELSFKGICKILQPLPEQDVTAS